MSVSRLVILIEFLLNNVLMLPYKTIQILIVFILHSRNLKPKATVRLTSMKYICQCKKCHYLFFKSYW